MPSSFAVATFALAALSSAIELASAQLLANGNYFQAGNISPIWRWQASGLLYHGRCPFSVASQISDCYQSFLDATGDLESTTQSDYLAAMSSSSAAAAQPTTPARRSIEFGGELAARGVFNSSNYAVYRKSMSATQKSAEQRALMNDEDLESYFEAFPDQLPYRFANYMSYPHGSSFKAKRQVVGCGTGGGSTTTQPPSSTTTTSAPATSTTATPPSPRQRNEIFTWPGATAGQTWRYTWKSYQSTTTSTSYNFFHSWQILRRDGCGGPVVTLDYLDGNVVIQDTVRGCKDCASYMKHTIGWFGQVIYHDLNITYGINGSIDYLAKVSDALRPGMLRYSAKGDMGSSASLKVGNYRKQVAGMTAATAYIGDFVSKQLA